MPDGHCGNSECQEVSASIAATVGEECSNELQCLQGLIERASAPGMAVTETVRAGFELMRKCIRILFDPQIDQIFSQDEEAALIELHGALKESEPAKRAAAVLIRAANMYVTCIALPSAPLKFSGMAVTWRNLQELEEARCEMLANAELWSSILQIYATAHSRYLNEVAGADRSKGLDVGDFPLKEVHEDEGWRQGSQEWELDITGEALTTSTFKGALMFWCELLIDHQGTVPVPVTLKRAGEYRRLLEEGLDRVSSLDAVKEGIAEQNRARNERKREERFALRRCINANALDLTK